MNLTLKIWRQKNASAAGPMRYVGTEPSPRRRTYGRQKRIASGTPTMMVSSEIGPKSLGWPLIVTARTKPIRPVAAKLRARASVTSKRTLRFPVDLQVR